MGACCKLKSFGPLLIRLGLGTVFIAHGSQKVLGLWGGSGLKASVENFMGMGHPEWVAYAICLGEFLGGIGVAVGCLTRLAGLGLATIMGGAIYLVHLQYGFFLNHSHVPDKGDGMEYSLVLLAMALSLVFTGAGCLSIDRLLFGKKKKCCSHGASGETPPIGAA